MSPLRKEYFNLYKHPGSIFLFLFLETVFLLYFICYYYYYSSENEVIISI